MLRIKVFPKSSQPGVGPVENEMLKVRVGAAADQGKANAAVIKLLSKLLGIPQARIRLLSGEKSRMKSLKILDMSPEDVRRLLLQGTHP